MSEPAGIGTVKGPGETPNEYTLHCTGPGTPRQAWRVCLLPWPTWTASERAILGRVTGRRPVKLFPDSFMADPACRLRQVAELLGYDSDASELFEITVTVLGYHSRPMGDFINPRVPPAGGSPVYIAADDLLAQVLSKRRKGERGSAHLGSLLSRPEDAVPVALDVRGFTSTHLAIIASTGSGKSYLAGVLLEELMMPHNRGVGAGHRSARRVRHAARDA